MDEQNAEPAAKKPSKLWYLAPIFLGVIGCLVGYLAIKDEDRDMAKRLLIVGLIVTFIWAVIGIILPTATYLLAAPAV